MNPLILITILIVFAIWLGGLTFFIWKSANQYKNLFKNSKEQTISAVLDSLLKTQDKSSVEISGITERIVAIEENNLKNIQKIGLVRFNPFNDTGGEQSFILALVDARETGIVISGLYARSGMRWYIKKFKQGKGLEHELSVEERKAIETAR